jgi:hypothetical protein
MRHIRNPTTPDELRTLRLARGLRAVAASVIIGGIVIAALDTAPRPAQFVPHEVTPEMDSGATAVPLPSGPSEAVPGNADSASEPVLQGANAAMEPHG